eukprot:1134187-Pelagomonas_calceolata.AAC.2
MPGVARIFDKHQINARLHTAPACGPHAAARTAARTACSLPLAAVVAPPYWQGCSGSFPLLAVDAPPGAI